MNDNMDMGAVKPNGEEWTIKEQIVRDEVTGLTLQFELRPSGRPRLIITGDAVPFGNREIGFSHDGVECDGGTHVSECPNPGWVGGKF